MTKYELQKKIFKLLKKEKWIAVDNTKLKNAKMPDIVAFKNGVTIFLEIRIPGVKLTPLQKNRLKTLSEKGFVAEVIYDPIDLTYTFLNITLEDLKVRLLARMAQLICEEERIDSDWKVQVLRLFAYGKVEEIMKEVAKITKQLDM